jgi:hypothetical protein
MTTTIDPAKLAELTALASMTDAHKAHFGKLAGTDRDAFMKADAAGRDAIVAKASAGDPVVYKSAAGIEVRVSDGPATLALAKALDGMQAENATLKSALDATKTAADAAEVDRIVAKLGHIGKPLDEKRKMVAAIMKLDGEARAAALDGLMAGATQFAAITKLAGVAGGSAEQMSAQQKINQMAAERIQKGGGATTYEKTVRDILNTPEGAALYEASLPENQRVHGFSWH